MTPAAMASGARVETADSFSEDLSVWLSAFLLPQSVSRQTIGAERAGKVPIIETVYTKHEDLGGLFR